MSFPSLLVISLLVLMSISSTLLHSTSALATSSAAPHFSTLTLAAHHCAHSHAKSRAVEPSSGDRLGNAQQQKQVVFGSDSRKMSSGSGDGQDRGISLQGQRKQVLEDAMALFQSKVNREILNRSWREDAIFEDPIALCRGFSEYAPQWYGMPKAFPKSETLSYKVVTSEPNLIEYEQTQLYTVALTGFKKEMKSLVHIELDDQDKVKKFEDRWGGKPLPSSSIAVFLRRVNARTMPWLIKVPSEAEETKKSS